MDNVSRKIPPCHSLFKPPRSHKKKPCCPQEDDAGLKSHLRWGKPRFLGNQDIKGLRLFLFNFDLCELRIALLLP
jgi:hypothetical protein